MDEKSKKKIEKKTKEFIKSARAFLLAKAGGIEIPAEWELSIYMLEIYFKQFLELNEEISAMDSLLVQSKYGMIVTPLCSARDKAAVRLESLMKQMGMTMKSGKQIGSTDIKKEESPLDTFLKAQNGKIEKR